MEIISIGLFLCLTISVSLNILSTQFPLTEHRSFSSPDPELAHHTSFFAVTLALSTNWLWKIALSQSSLQKLLAVPTVQKARICLITSCAGVILMKLLSCFLGLTMYAWFAGCDPLISGQIKKHEQVRSGKYFIVYLIEYVRKYSSFI